MKNNEILFGRKHNGKKIISGRFSILLPEVFGFCGGVIAALNKLEGTISTNPDPRIFLLGEIIHNSTVNRYFLERGVNIIPHQDINKIFTIAQHEDLIVIPAFGIPLRLEQKIRSQYRNVIDTTCRNVKSVWRFLESESGNKATTILFGRKHHPEVEAVISRAGESCVIILPSILAARGVADIVSGCTNEDELANASGRISRIDGISILNETNFNGRRFCFASQTTMLCSEALEIEKILGECFARSGVIFNPCRTICRATWERQEAALELCKSLPDLILVVGGYDSSNTNHLYDLASKYSRTIYIGDDTALSRDQIRHFLPGRNQEISSETKVVLGDVKTIGILAGASCPFFVINSIIEKLKDY